ncbi:hypothetical protein HD593_002201 [Nonomuraea rubra]|uniref:Uncharacterized protein n=1 Tax=Nonomuraea rubra TaxID=46180 RepID=A0A7X0NPX4_9ACTN|nr:hypothetical protein [Nonomuraea rubra]MBB6547406.1 hypothetical protein [Nonomuraea rubra]
MPVGVGLHDHLHPGGAGVGRPVLGRERDRVEVEPPQAHGDADPEHGGHEQRDAHGVRAGAGADGDGDDRLADRQQDEHAVPLAPVSGAVHPPVAAAGGEIGARPVDEQAPANSAVCAHPPSSAPATRNGVPASRDAQDSRSCRRDRAPAAQHALAGPAWSPSQV